MAMSKQFEGLKGKKSLEKFLEKRLKKTASKVIISYAHIHTYPLCVCDTRYFTHPIHTRARTVQQSNAHTHMHTRKHTQASTHLRMDVVFVPK